MDWVAGFTWTEWQPSHGLGGRHPWNMQAVLSTVLWAVLGAVLWASMMRMRTAFPINALVSLLRPDLLRLFRRSNHPPVVLLKYSANESSNYPANRPQIPCKLV